MAFLVRGGSLDISIPAGQSIALGSPGSGQAAIYYQTSLGNTPQQYYLQQYLVGSTVTLGPFSGGINVRIFASAACELEYVVGASPVLSGSGAAVRQVTLSTNYTLTAGDDGTQFVCTTAVTVTVPAGLNPNPNCTFAPPASGSVTLHPTGGATLNGATSDIICSIVTNPAPVGLARTSVADGYGVTGPNSFGSLTGAVSDNAALVAYLAANCPPIPTANKQSTGYTIAAADHTGYVWLSLSASDKTFTLPAGLPINFRCFIGAQSTSAVAGRLILAPANSVVVNYNTSAGTFVHNNNQASIFFGTANATCYAMAMLACNGTQDSYNLAWMTGSLTTT